MEASWPTRASSLLSAFCEVTLNEAGKVIIFIKEVRASALQKKGMNG
jgi:hypothetical protein